MEGSEFVGIVRCWRFGWVVQSVKFLAETAGLQAVMCLS